MSCLLFQLSRIEQAFLTQVVGIDLYQVFLGASKMDPNGAVNGGRQNHPFVIIHVFTH